MSKMFTIPNPPSSSNGGSSDERTPSSKVSQEKAKVATIRPEIVTVQKDHMNLLLAKCQSLQTQLQAMKNLQLVIDDAYSRLEKEKKKSAKYQTALIATEARLSEMVRVQLENTALYQQLPFLSHVQRPVGKATRLPQPALEHDSGQKQEVLKAKSEPPYDGEDEDDLEIDGAAPHHSSKWDSGFLNQSSSASYQSYRSSGYFSGKSSLESSKADDVKTKVHDGKNITLSPEEYENIIQKLTLTVSQLKLEIKDLRHLLEAKTNGNIDAVTKQLSEALKKIETLTTSNKHKDTLLQNYYKAYTALSKKDASDHATPDTTTITDADMESSSANELRKIILRQRKEHQQLTEKHQREMVEQRGLFLREREKAHILETRLESCKQTIQEAQSRHLNEDSDFPLTIGDLREKNKYLQESIELHQHQNIKLSQEKERAVAGWTLVADELDKIKKERKQLESQIKKLREQMTDPARLAEISDTRKERDEAKQETEQSKKQTRELTASLKKSQHQLESMKAAYDKQSKKCQDLQRHTQQQQQLILSLQQQQPQQLQQQQQLKKEDSVSASKEPSVADEENLLECPRCCKEFTLVDVEKYQQHLQKCTDE